MPNRSAECVVGGEGLCRGNHAIILWIGSDPAKSAEDAKNLGCLIGVAVVSRSSVRRSSRVSRPARILDLDPCRDHLRNNSSIKRCVNVVLDFDSRIHTIRE